MRVVLVVFLATFVLAGCKRETQEAVAQAKGAAAAAERAAREAADQVAATARSTKDQAKATADDSLTGRPNGPSGAQPPGGEASPSGPPSGSPTS